MNDYFSPTIDRISSEDLFALQEQRFLQTLKHAAAHSPLYRQKYTKKVLSAVKTLRDIEKLPFTTKDELVTLGHDCVLAVPKEEVVEVHFSSGTTKAPVASFLTSKDIIDGRVAMARTWYMQGVRQSSIFGMLATYGLFSAGLLNHYAIQEIGAFVLPISNAPTEKIIELLSSFQIDTLAAVASHYFHLLRRIQELHLSTDNLRLKTVIAGGEPFTEAQRKYIQDHLHVKMYDQYGLCEINTGLAGECEKQNGLHILADYAYPEIIDPTTGATLKEGETGELVLTTLQKKASPLLRYRTGDITSITYAPCACGRTHPRIARIRERVSKTIFYKGLKLERGFIRDAVAEAEKYIDPYLWEFSVESDGIESKVKLKVLPTHGRDESEVIAALTAHIRKKLGFHPEVMIFSAKEKKELEGHKVNHFKNV